MKQFNDNDRFLSLQVYKFPLGNCGGVTDHNKHVYIPHPEGYITWANIKKDGEEHLVFTEEQRGKEYWALNPIVEPTDNMIGPMAGGNLAYTSDSRCIHVYHIHDRFETQEHYDANWH